LAGKNKKLVNCDSVIIIVYCSYFNDSVTLFSSSLGANEYIETVHSPDGNYTINRYRFDTGAAGSFGAIILTALSMFNFNLYN
jgi:hypothetical protein